MRGGEKSKWIVSRGLVCFTGQMQAKTAIIFDLDGTIANSLDAMVAVYNQVAPRYGTKIVDPQTLKVARETGSLKQLMQTHGISGWKLPFILLAIRSRLKKSMRDVALQPGLAEAIHALKQRGYLLGVLTSNAKSITVPYLRAQGLVGDFQFIKCDFNLFGKDKALKKLIAVHGLDPKQTYYVGDEVRDMEAAKKAGIRTIAVTWGFQSHQAFAAYAPEFILDQPQELTKLFP